MGIVDSNYYFDIDDHSCQTTEKNMIIDIAMNNRLTPLLDTISHYSILALVVLVPLFFWTTTTEFFDTPKFLILIIVSLILLTTSSVSLLASSKLTITRTPFDLPLLMLLVVGVVSTFFTTAKWVGILGNFPRLHGGFASLAFYVLLYLLLVANIKKISQVKTLQTALIFVGGILSVISLTSFFGYYLPFSFARLANFTPTGSNFSTTAMLVLLLPLPVLEILSGKKMSQPIWTFVFTLFALTIALTGSWGVYLAAALVTGLAVLSVSQSSVRKNFLYLLTPVVLVVITATLTYGKLSFLPNNPLRSRASAFVQELQLPFITSWKTSVSAFRDSPFWGTGPGTYLFDFTYYKPLEFNQTENWNKRFDLAFNEYLGVLGTLGGAGLLSLLLLTVIFLSLALQNLIWAEHQTQPAEEINLQKSLSLSGIAFFLLLFLHPSTLILWVVGLIILASFAVVSKKVSQLALSHAFGKSADTSQALESLPGIALMVVILLVGFVLFFGGKFLLADVHHRKALNFVAKGAGIDAYNALIKAENLNPYVDLYRTDLAQTNFALANAIALSKPADATGAAGLTDTDKQNIQTLLSQAINEAKTATVLSPNNAGNWEILGSIYRQIAGVAQNALVFALDSYGKAIARDPFNPNLRLTAGGVYYSVKNYDLAIRLFTDSIALKADFANGYYNLAVALKDKGDKAQALAAAQKLATLVDPKSADYQVAANLLKDLDNKEVTATPPAAESSSALSKKDLPKVINLPKPDKISTPEAVKK